MFGQTVATFSFHCQTVNKMSFGHFVKHLSCTIFLRLPTLLRCRILPPSSPLLTLLSPLSFTYSKSTNQTPPDSINATISRYSSSSPSSSSSNDSFASPYLSVSIRSRKDVADMLSEALLCFGASSTSVDEDEDGVEGSDEIFIHSIFPVCKDVGVCISYAADSIGLQDVPNYEVKMGDQYDWVTKTQESFHPVEVTEGLWIVPEWITPPAAEATNIILNPGLSFGTGEHPTTKLCILLLHGLIKGGEHFLDYGTGSGILAIAALKLGAASSVGVDIDPLAITSARQNAALNNIRPENFELRLVSSDNCLLSTNESTDAIMEQQFSHGKGIIPQTKMYDVVIANILLNPLLDLADHIVSYAKPGAVVGLSGILCEQVPDIINRYSQFIEGISVTRMDDWACVSGTRKRNDLT